MAGWGRFEIRLRDGLEATSAVIIGTFRFLIGTSGVLMLCDSYSHRQSSM
jgi:hypothetical protein